MVLELTPRKQLECGAECHVAGLLLAAGSSTRAGSVNKLLSVKNHSGLETGMTSSGLPDRMSSMVIRSAQALLSTGIQTVIAVTGESHNQIAAQLQPLGYRMVQNPDAKRGMGTSLKIGLEHLQHVDAVLVCLADMPDLKTATLKSIVNCWQESSRDKFIVPTYKGRRGNPVMIPSCFFSEFCQHDGDIGAKAVIQQHPEQVLTFETGDPSVLTDYDTREQLHAAGWQPHQVDYEKQ